MAAEQMSKEDATRECEQVLDTIESAVIAERTFLERVLLGIMSRGHVLLEDVPGTGKTLTARSFASALGVSFSRIQFTPDLLPTDITGTHIYNEQDREFEFQRGPIFANIVLADEINRAPPKTQAAMLEAMGEGQVTVGDETRELPEPFFVIATQNPVEQEGTFPLPEAQLDRFMIQSSIGYPGIEGEVELLRRRGDRNAETPSVESVLDETRLRNLRQVPETVRVDEDLRMYMAQIVQGTRQDHRVSVGVSPRGTQRLYEAARAYATLRGVDYVKPDHVKNIAEPVLAHRLVLNAEAQVNDVSKRTVIEDVLSEVEVPTVE